MKSEEVYLSFIPFVDSGGFKLTSTHFSNLSVNDRHS